MTPRLLALLVLLAGCKETQTLDGQVVDIWGNPVTEATIVMEGQTTRPSTDAYGNFSLPFIAGTQKIKAGREGYIQEHIEVEVVEGEPPPPVILRLYPKPEENGFYVVGKGDYARLAPEKVYRLGNELVSITGIKSVQARVESDPFEIVFHTDIRMDEIMRLGLEMHALEYKKTATVLTALGEDEVKVNLWISKGEIPIQIDAMRSRNDYKVTAEESMKPGWYAFHTQDLLDPKEADKFAAVPEALRVAYPFELR
jgi:hypothetical protein